MNGDGTPVNTGVTAIGVGSQAGATGGGQDRSTALGSGALANVANGTAIGQGAIASIDNSVAIGQGSTTTAASSIDGNAALGVRNNAGAVATGSGNVVSIGTAGNERQIQNLAAGAVTATSTDAVNGSQLFGVATSVNAIGAGTVAALGGGASYNPATGTFTGPTYTFQNGTQFTNVGSALGNLDTRTTTNTNSIAALQNGQSGLVQQTGPNAPITVGAATGGTVVNVSGTAGNRQITGVAAGNLAAGSTDAVNGSQLFATNQQVATNTANITANGQAIGVLQGQTATNTGNITALQNGQAGPFRDNNTSGSPAPSPTGANAIAGGFGSVASGASSVAIGRNAQATQAGATAIGAGAVASGDPTTAVGFNAAATGAEASAFGAFATASATNSTALGRSANAAGANAVAVGFGSSAAQANSVAIGAGVATTRANQVAIGNATQTYTLAGIGSAQSLAAQTGASRFVTSDAAGNLATANFGPNDIGALDGRVGALEASLNGLTRYAIESRKEARRGIATAMALSTAPLPSAPGRMTYVLNGATFKGEYGIGGAIAYRLDTNIPLAITAGVAGGPGNNVGGRIGIMGEL